MKCKFCAADMAIEDAKCPHCGKDNPYYEAHRVEMDNYARKYKRIENEVVETTTKYTRKTLVITVISLLTALILGCIFVLISMDDINYSRFLKKNAQNADKIAQRLEEYEQNADYITLADYYDSVPMRYSKNATTEYTAVYDMSAKYRSFVAQTVEVTSKKLKSTDASDYAKRITSTLDMIYHVTNGDAIRANYPERYSGQHAVAIEDIMDRINHLLVTYYGMTEEEAIGLKDMSETKMQSFLEDKLLEVFKDEQ